jgi:hypothetical protein
MDTLLVGTSVCFLDYLNHEGCKETKAELQVKSHHTYRLMSSINKSSDHEAATRTHLLSVKQLANTKKNSLLIYAINICNVICFCSNVFLSGIN